MKYKVSLTLKTNSDLDIDNDLRQRLEYLIEIHLNTYLDETIDDVKIEHSHTLKFMTIDRCTCPRCTGEEDLFRDPEEEDNE